MPLLEATTIALPFIPVFSTLLRVPFISRLLAGEVRPRGFCQVLPFLCPR